MEKSLFTILLVFLGVGVLFGGYKFFEEPKIEPNPENINLIDAKRLPLRDSRISFIPKKDYVMSCQDHFFASSNEFRDGDRSNSDGAKNKGEVSWKGNFETKVEDVKQNLIDNALPNHYASLQMRFCGTGK